jgi:hypothetical protein
MIEGINRWQLVLGYPAGKQECPLFLNEKWTLRGLCMDFATMSTVVKVTVRARPNEVHVGRSLHGPLLMLSKKSLHGPGEVHFFLNSQKTLIQ